MTWQRNMKERTTEINKLVKAWWLIDRIEPAKGLGESMKRITRGAILEELNRLTDEGEAERVVATYFTPRHREDTL